VSNRFSKKIDASDTARLEAFSDGVLAIAITIMVLELRTPTSGDLSELKDLAPSFATYILSFAFIGLYWNNHHHLFRATRHISTAVMWANLLFLFFLSLIPFATAWLGTNLGEAWPTAFYGGLCFCVGLGYFALTRAIVAANPGSKLETALDNDRKGFFSELIYGASIGFAFVNPTISYVLFTLVALAWFIPDRRLTDAHSAEERNRP
jgi:uncharacterized membrane protein